MSFEDPRLADPTRMLPNELIVHTADQEWRPAGEGLYYKLLRVDPTTGVWEALFRMTKGAVINRHLHKGAIASYMIEGSMRYRGDLVVSAGDYSYEPLGALHDTATVLEDVLCTSTFYGPVEMLDDDGNTIGIWDWEWVLRDQAGIDQASLSSLQAAG